MGVDVKRFFVQRIKTKWGSCNPQTRCIRLNTELAKKPRESLEYIVVHELVHLLEPTHNARFVALMDHLMPQWRFCREQLNQLPVRMMNGRIDKPFRKISLTDAYVSTLFETRKGAFRLLRGMQ